MVQHDDGFVSEFCCLGLAKKMLEEQPLDLSVRVADEGSRDEEPDIVKKEPEEFAEAALRLRGLNGSVEYPDREDRTCSEDSDDSCSDNKDGAGRSRARPPGTKPYKKNLMRRYRKSPKKSVHLLRELRSQ